MIPPDPDQEFADLLAKSEAISCSDRQYVMHLSAAAGRAGYHLIETTPDRWAIVPRSDGP